MVVNRLCPTKGGKYWMFRILISFKFKKITKLDNQFTQENQSNQRHMSVSSSSSLNLA